MNKTLRKAVIAGNWKMNMTPSEAAAAVKKTAELVAGKDGCEIVLCVPFVDIAAVIVKGVTVVRCVVGNKFQRRAQRVALEDIIKQC